MVNFIQYIRDRWALISKTNGQKGTVVDELAVKPTGVVISEFYNKLIDIKNINDITKWEDMTDEELDAFGSKFFIPRINGSKATTTVRIRFNTRQDIMVSKDVIAATNNGYQFSPTAETFISANSMKASEDNISLFYIDIPFVSLYDGTSYNIDSGKIVRLDNFDYDYTSVTNVTPAFGGSDYENNEDYYKRLVYSINDRSMMLKSGVYSLLKGRFPAVLSIYVAGAGDKYMERDLVTASNINKYNIDYRGKVPNNQEVKSKAYSYIFPPDLTSAKYSDWFPFSSYSAYQYPQSILPLVNSYDKQHFNDAAFFGYDLNNEFDIENYSGVYYNDFSKNSIAQTDNLVDIANENVPTNSESTIPNHKWFAGANGYNFGNFGEVYEGADYNLIGFQGNDITLRSGCKYPITTGLNVNKRAGVRLTASFTSPTDDSIYENSNINFIVAGSNDFKVNSFSGLGLGVMYTSSYDGDNKNAVLYLFHNEEYDTSDAYVISGSTMPVVGQYTSLAEIGIKLPTGIKVNIELTLTDDLSLTGYLSYQLGTTIVQYTIEAPSKVISTLNGTDGITVPDSTHFGEVTKVTLVSETDVVGLDWVVSDFKVRDINARRATMLFALDASKINKNAIIKSRAYGSGASNGVFSEGYSVYVWDKEAATNLPSLTHTYDGGWAKLYSLSNPNGGKLVGTDLLEQELYDVSRYIVETASDKFIYLMFVSSCVSHSTNMYNNDIVEDIESNIMVDYITIEDSNTKTYHANNKADLHVVTIKNTEKNQTATVTVPYNGYAVIEGDDKILPIKSIESIVSNAGTQIETVYKPGDFVFYKQENGYENSIYETNIISIDGSYISDTVTINYIPYPSITDIQNYLNETKVYGDIIVKHKIPVELSFALSIASELTNDEIINYIWGYIDKNSSDIFSTRDLVSNMYNDNIVSNIKEPITVNYVRHKKDIYNKTGSFTDVLEISEIEYFEASSISIERL